MLEALNLKVIKNRNYTRLRLFFKHRNLLVLTAPKQVSQKKCLEFLKENHQWIQTQYQSLNQEDFKSLLKTDCYYLFGEWRAFDNETIKSLWQDFLYQSHSLSKKSLSRFYYKALYEYLEERVAFFALKMQLEPQGFKIGKSYRTLGRCSSHKQLCFSLQLSLLPKHLIDSVIIHELAHIQYFNHSKDFWNLISQYDKNPKQVHCYLKENHFFHQTFFYEILK
ncbi:MAG: DUF45 domain-containing protein [Helicobacter sp.]|nr:DUF45 domain-containing protein [Helicobacter sp.]